MDAQAMHGANVDITMLKGTLRNKKISWRVVPEEISGDHNIKRISRSSQR
jgi:hypothetical protein